MSRPPKSLYLRMSDGIRLAADVWLPGEARGQLPTILRATKYWRRATEARIPDAEVFNANGYAYVVLDVRGSGASFGSWGYRDLRETEDLGEVVDWIVRQPWSNGRVAGHGISYDANTAERLAATGRAEVRAAVPRFSDFDVFALQRYPGGLPFVRFLEDWGAEQIALDLNDATRGPAGSHGELAAALGDGPKPVDEDGDGRLLAEALSGRTLDDDVYGQRTPLVCRDDTFAGRPSGIDAASAFPYRAAIERVGAAYFSWSSWFDAGTAAGALSRFATFDNPQTVVIGPWSHGTRGPAVPYCADPSDTPSAEDQLGSIIEFLDPLLKGGEEPRPGSTIRYYTVGAGSWSETSSWPPPGTSWQQWHLQADSALSRVLPDAEGEDRYLVDLDASTGRTNRWHAQMAVPVEYGDRAEADRRLLTYTSAPLPKDIEIAGHPAVHLTIRASTPDAALYVYLEEVDPAGRVTYLTEGQLRALHRAISSYPPYEPFGPYHSFRSADARPLVPGEPAELDITLFPVAARIARGHRLRVAIAGHDRDSFLRVPATGAPTIWVQRGRDKGSRLSLPVLG